MKEGTEGRKAGRFVQKPGIQEPGRRGPVWAELESASHGLRGRTRQKIDSLRDSGQAGDATGGRVKRV